MKKKLLLFLLIPIVTFSQVQIGSTLIGEDSGDNFGRAVSVSGDGSTIAIGAPSNDGNGNNSGHVRIYKNESDVWNQINLDIDGEAEEDNSGFSVSLSDDGNTVAIGARFNGSRNFGHVRVFKNESGSWIQLGSDIDGGNLPDERFGWSVSLSGDGSVLAVGAPLSDMNGEASGVVRIYENKSGEWNQIGTDIPGDAANDNLGWSVHLSADGNVVAIGIPYGKIDQEWLGLVRVYRNESGIWNQIGSDIQGIGVEDATGYSVSLSDDGSILAVGTPYSDINGDDSGAVRIYKNDSDVWNQIGSDIKGVWSNDLFGYSVSLSGDGSLIAIGSPSDDDYVHIYQNISEVWTLRRIFEGEKAFDWFGSSVSLSNDGTILGVGAPRNDDNGSSSGHVRAFDLNQILDSPNNLVQDHFKIYPNPATKELTINMKQNTELISVSIYNTYGRLLYTSHKAKLDISDFSSGIYFVETKTSKGKSLIKFVKE